jgi:hypothetical protein
VEKSGKVSNFKGILAANFPQSIFSLVSGVKLVYNNPFEIKTLENLCQELLNFPGFPAQYVGLWS